MDNQNLGGGSSVVRYSKIPWILLAIEFLYPIIILYIGFKKLTCIGFCPGTVVFDNGPSINAIFGLCMYFLVLVSGVVYSIKSIVKYRNNTPIRFYLLLVMPIILTVIFVRLFLI